MSNDVEYSPDFEASENDTSQLVSGQSEILDEVESSTFTASKSEAGVKQTPPFTAESAEKVAPERQKDEEKSEETSPSVRNKELEEIEDIIRKLERLEKAQTMLEDALHLSDAEQDLGDISERSERSLPSRSIASSFQSSRKGGGGSRNLNQASPLSDRAAGSKHEDLSEVINNGLASIQEIIEKEKDLMQPLKVDRPPSPPALLSTSSEKSSRKSASASRSSKMQKKSKVVPLVSIIDESGDHDGKRLKPSAPVESPDMLLKLKSEIARDEGLILAYQKENEKLYSQLKAAQEEIQAKDAHHAEEVNGLKTEIATLKLNRLVSSGSSSPRLGSAHKGELDRLNEELTAKSLMIVELRKEIALLKVEKESRPISAKRMKSPVLCINKEKEYQDKIRALQKQVRTLQRILYSKESKPAASPAPLRANLASKGRALSLGKFEVNNRRANSASSVDQDAVKRLEDTMRKERAELQHKINEKQCIIEEKELQLNTLKLELTKLQNEPSRRVSEDAEAESAILEQLQNRLLNQSEIIQSLKDQLKSLKDVEQERNALKREVGVLDSKTKDLEKKVKRAENMARPSFRAGSAPAKPNDTGKPAVGAEKDYQKQIQNLQKQVRTLQKILYSKDPSAATANATTTNAPNRLSMSAGNKEEMFGVKQGQTGKPEALKKCTTTPSLKSNYNAQVLQATFDQERQEMEHLLEHRQKQIDDRDRQIRELKSKLCATIEENAWVASESATEKANYEEFRAKLATQSKIIESLQQRLASYGNIEAEKCLLKKDIGQLEFRIQDLQRRLSRAENLARPENEVLATLSEKVEDLHTRYYYRERQLDTLLDRLSVKTGAILSPRSSSYRCRNGNLSGSSGLTHREDFNLASLSRSHNNHNSGIDMGDLSPSAALHMIPHRDVPEI